MRASVTSVEETVDCVQQYQDLQKHHLDWSKQMWSRLQAHTDYSGNRATVESRLDKVSRLHGGAMSEGRGAIEALGKHVAAAVSGEDARLPQRAREAMQRDLDNVRHDYDKLDASFGDVLQGLRGRIAQWTEYEAQFDKIVAWLTESESTLKGYGLKGSLEEKQEQLDRFQDFQRIVESWNGSIQEYISLADQLEQVKKLTHGSNT